jgi:cation diffusion facilitator family transporter
MLAMLRRIPKPEARAAGISIGVGVALLAVKFVAYFVTGSAAIFSDALESIVNVTASAMALYALGVAHTPADSEHPYGHGKIEFMSAGIEGGMILVAAVVIAVKAVDTMLFHEVVVERLGFGLAMMGSAMVVNGGVGWHLVRVGRRTSSLSLEADGHHLLSDAVTSAVALVALLLVRFMGWRYADPVGAILIAAYIGWMGVRLISRSGAGLMDRQDVEDERLLREILDGHTGPAGREPRICSYHKLRHRHSGRYHWVDFHVMVPASLTVREGHEIASAIEYEIEQRLGEGNATAHIEPCGEPRCTRC